jgi:hypothetical protein
MERDIQVMRSLQGKPLEGSQRQRMHQGAAGSDASSRSSAPNPLTPRRPHSHHEARHDRPPHGDISYFFWTYASPAEWTYSPAGQAGSGGGEGLTRRARAAHSGRCQNDGKLAADKQIKLDPGKSLLGYKIGDEIKLREDDFLLLAKAFFAEIERKFL